MILPTRHLTAGQSLLGVAARLLARLDEPRTVNSLWEETRDELGVATFDRFVLALDLLFLLGAIELSAGMISVRQ